MERKSIQMNPYDSAERLAMFERLRRAGDLDAEMDNEMGRLLMDLTTFSIGLYRKRKKLFNEPDELYEDCVCCAVESIRKSNPDDPVSVVRYVMASVQNKIRCIMRDKINREQLLYSYNTVVPAIELTAELDGSPPENPWETLKVFARKEQQLNDEVIEDVKEDV